MTDDINAAGEMRKLVGRRIEWRIIFQERRFQARPNREESNAKRCDYFEVFATDDEGREVGFLTRQTDRDGIVWRGKIDGFDVQAYRSADLSETERREVFDLFYAAHCQGWKNDCEAHEHDEAVEQIEKEAA